MISGVTVSKSLSVPVKSNSSPQFWNSWGIDYILNAQNMKLIQGSFLKGQEGSRVARPRSEHSVAF